MAKSGELGSLVVRIRADNKALARGLKQSESQVKSFSQSTKKSFVDLASKVFLFNQAISATGMIFNAVVGPAIEFESAFAGVKKTVDATSSEFEALRSNILKMSVEIPVTARELASIQETAGQLGIRGVKNLTKFTKAIAKISVTTNLSAQEASLNFARISAVIGENIENIENMGSAVVDLGNKFEVNEQEILGFANRIAGAGKIAKLTTADVFGISAALAAVGIEAQAGGTAVQKVLLSLQKQGKTGIGAFTGFVRDLQDAGEDASKMLDELGFKDVRLQRAFLSLAGAGEKLEKALKISNEAFADGNALTEEAEKRFETTESKLKLLKNEFSLLSIELGENLLPALNKTLRILTKIIKVGKGFASALSVKDAIEPLLGGDARLLAVEALIEKLGSASAALEELRRRKEEGEEEFPGLSALTGEPDQNTFTAGADTEDTLGGENKVPFGDEFQQNFENAKAAIGEFKAQLAELNMNVNNLAMQSAKLINGQISQLSKGIGDAFAQMVVNGKNFGKSMKVVFKQMAISFISGVIEMIVKWIVFNAIAKALQAGQVAAAAGFAATLTAIWTVPATLASIATQGAAVGIGNTALATGLVSAKGMTAGLQAVPTGRDGIITTGGFGEGGIPAVLHPNEIVAPLDKFFESLNSAKDSGQVNITINGNVDDPQEFAEMLSTEIDRSRRGA